MKKILYILEATTGGTRRHLDDLVLNLDRARFEPVVACSLRRDTEYVHSVEAMKRRGVQVHTVTMHRAPSPLADLIAVSRLCRLIKREQPDIIHTHSSKAGFLGRVAARWARAFPVVHTPHGFPFEMWTGPARRRAYRWAETFALRMTNALVCVCPEEKDIAESLAPEAANIASMIPNGIDTTVAPAVREDALPLRAELDIPADATVVGWIGRHCLQKGLPHLVDAASRLPASESATVFVLVGDGPDRLRLKRRCAERGVNAIFRFVPATPSPRIYYGLFDVFVLPSLWEALPYTLLDAMWAGLPVVASDVGGVGGALQRSGAGIAVPPANADALCQGLQTMITDAGARINHGAHGHDYVQAHHRLTDMITRTEMLYDAVLDAAGE